MLRIPHFWDLEKNSPLFDKEEGFLERDGGSVFERVQSWPGLVGNEDDEKKWNPCHGLPEPRIIVMDAERTFTSPDHRKLLSNFLTFVASEFKDYAQGLSYLASFLLLYLQPEKVFAIVSALNCNSKYIPGYWKHEAVAFATDAYVFDHLLKRFHPLVAAHLSAINIMPETYCQKWFVGFCIHVLPFEFLFEFIEKFLADGFRFLFRFGLSLVAHLADDILTIDSVSKIYEILRLDITSPPYSSIVSHADDYVFPDVDFPCVRADVYDQYLRPRMEAYRRRVEEEQAQDSEEEFSDDDNSDDDEDEADSGGQECQLCHNMVPEIYCRDCKLKICEMCQERKIDDHLPTHVTISLEKFEEDGDDVPTASEGSK